MLKAEREQEEAKLAARVAVLRQEIKNAERLTELHQHQVKQAELRKEMVESKAASKIKMMQERHEEVKKQHEAIEKEKLRKKEAIEEAKKTKQAEVERLAKLTIAERQKLAATKTHQAQATHAEKSAAYSAIQAEREKSKKEKELKESQLMKQRNEAYQAKILAAQDTAAKAGDQIQSLEEEESKLLAQLNEKQQKHKEILQLLSQKKMDASGAVLKTAAQIKEVEKDLVRQGGVPKLFVESFRSQQHDESKETVELNKTSKAAVASRSTKEGESKSVGTS